MPSGVQSQHIQTATKLRIIEDHLNAWEDFAGDDLVGDVLYWTAPTVSPYDYEQTWWGYRGQAAMCKPDLAAGMSFDGVDDYITFGDNYDFPATASFSISLWLKINTLSASNPRLLTKDAADGWRTYVTSTGSVQFQRQTSSVADTATGASNITTGVWYQLTFVYNGTDMTVYINGVAGTPVASSRSLPGNTSNLTIGRQANGAGAWLDGQVWGVAVWSKALSSIEVATLYDATRITAKQYEDAVNAISSLSSYWRLTQSTSTMTDSVGALSGTVNGSPSRHTSGPFDTHSIVRVRNGNGATSNRQIYYQTISNPEDASQWTSWTSLYTGTWYSVAIYPDVSASVGYRVVHASSTAIYVDNVSKITVSNVIALKPVVDAPPGNLYYCTVSQNAQDSKRVHKWYWTTAVNSGTAATAWLANYEWAHCDLAPFGYSDSSYWVTKFSCPYFANNSRSQTDSDALLDYSDDSSSFDTSSITDGIHMMRGASGRAGVRQFNELRMTRESDGYYYLFYTEEQRDTVTTNALTNLRRPLVWQRSLNVSWGWSEPTPCGYSIWGFAGIAIVNGYMYAAGNGKVLRRVFGSTETILDDYVLEGRVSIPRDNQKGTGQVVLANADNVVGDILGVSANEITTGVEKRIDLQLGQQVNLDEGYEYNRNNDWWIAGLSQSKDARRGKNRITIKLEDFWHRLGNKFRDRYYFPGEFSWIDWNDDASTNKTENWFSPSGQALSRESYTSGDDTLWRMVVPAGKVLFTPWKGHSAKLLQMSFSMGSHAATYLIFRWKDARNYYRLKYLTSTVTLQEVRNGNVTDLASAAAGSTSSTSFSLMVIVHFNRVYCYFNGSLKITHTIATYRRFSGHVGGWVNTTNWKMTYFSLTDIEAWVVTEELLRSALGYAGYHDIEVAEDIGWTKQLSVLWGPQTDIETPAEAIQKLLESNQLQMLVKWVDDAPVVYIDQFTGTTPDYSITDDIIEFSQVEEADKKFNVVMVDGAEHSWTEFYRPDLVIRGRTVNEYLDIPELLTQGEVQARANEVLDKSLRGNSPGGTVVWRPWFNKLDVVSWTDEFSDVWAMRIEGMEIEWNQGREPFQRATIDGGPLLLCDPNASDKTYVAYDSFTRVSSSGWGTADTGGAWTVNGTGTLWTVADGIAAVAPAVNSDYLAVLAGISQQSVKVQFKGSVDKSATLGYQNIGIVGHYIDSSNWLSIQLYLDTSGNSNIRVRKNLAGSKSVVLTQSIPEFSYTPGEFFKIQAEFTSDTVRAKIWNADDLEPSEYQVEYLITDSALQAAGGVGVRAFVSPSATDLPVTFSIDDFEAWT